MKQLQGRYVVLKTPELEAQVDTVMRGYQFESYAEMLRCLIRDAYRHLQRDAYYLSLTRHDIQPTGDPDPKDLVFCPQCKRKVPRKMWNSDPYFCDECCQEYC